jgi:ankyrin repeat protein
MGILLSVILVVGMLITRRVESVPIGDALYLAAARNDLNAFGALLDDLTSLETRDYAGYTPLALAASFGRRDAVELLLSRGASVDAGHPQLGSPLMLALANGHHEVAAALMVQGADIHVMFDGLDPLACALRSNDMEILKLLLTAGADMNAKGRRDNLLVLVMPDSGVEMVRALLAAGADPNVPGIDGTTPLMYAVETDAPQCARLLLQAGADPHQAGADGRTPHDVAKQRGCSQLLASARPGDARAEYTEYTRP